MLSMAVEKEIKQPPPELRWPLELLTLVLVVAIKSLESNCLSYLMWKVVVDEEL
jgi:hypothetical protein